MDEKLVWTKEDEKEYEELFAYHFNDKNNSDSEIGKESPCDGHSDYDNSFSSTTDVAKTECAKKGKKKNSKKAISDIVNDNVTDDEDRNTFHHVPSQKGRMNTYELVKHLTEVLPVKYYCNSMYISNGEYYELATKPAVIGLLQEVLGEKEKYFLDPKQYEAAADLLLSRRIPNKDNAKIQKHCVLFRNGLFNVKKWKFVEPKKDRMVFFKIDIDFDPDDNDGCPTFYKFLHDFSGGDIEIIARFLESMGYCLLPEDSAKAFFVFGTAADTGKSTFANFMTRLIGGNNVSHVALNDLSGTFDSSAILGKTINLSMDLEYGKVNNKSIRILKNATGYDPIMINIKFQEFKNYMNTSKFIFGTNHEIFIDNHDEAFWKRLKVIPCMNSIPPEAQDKKLAKKLWKERNAVVAELLWAAHNLIKNKYIFTPCEEADKIVNKWRYNKVSSVTSFINNCCTISHNPDVKTHTSDMYEAYKQYCEENNHDETVSLRTFSGILRSLYDLETKRWHDDENHFLRGYEGIELNSKA